MRRVQLLLFSFAVAGLAACAQPQVVIQAEIEGGDDTDVQVQPISGLEVRLYPFDRDEVFDSLAAAADSPEPEIPADLLQAQDSVAAAQRAWQQAESEWQTMRDRLAQISEEIRGLNRGESRYVQLFNEFRDLESRVDAAERSSRAAFEEFTRRSEETIARADEVRLLREQWADDAFETVGEVFAAKAAEAGRDILYDTTNAEGSTGTLTIPRGQWWVSARYELVFDELYWNVPVNIESTDPFTITLNSGNATTRPKI